MTLATLAFAPLSPATAAEAYRPPTSEERDHQVVIVHSDGTHERYMDSVVRIETDLGVSEHGERIISYNSTLETLEVLEAYTVLPDGRRVEVPPRWYSHDRR